MHLLAKIFTDYMHEWDKEMRNSDRRIVVFMDNFSGHPKLELTNIELVFLPTNTTSVLQPLDRGVIWSLKRRFKKKLLEVMVQKMNENV